METASFSCLLLEILPCGSGLCCSMLSHSAMSDSLQPHGLQSTRLLCPWGFSRQEYWCGLPCPPPGHLPNPRIKPKCPVLQAYSLPAELPGKPPGSGLVAPKLESQFCSFPFSIFFLQDTWLPWLLCDGFNSVLKSRLYRCCSQEQAIYCSQKKKSSSYL